MQQQDCVYFHILLKCLLCIILLVVGFKWGHLAQVMNSQSVYTKVFSLLVMLMIIYLSLLCRRRKSSNHSNNIRREYVTPTPMKRHQSVDCFNKESLVTMKPLKTPYLQFPSGACYELEDLEHMLRSRRAPLNDQPLSENEKKCAAHFLVNQNVENPQCQEIGGRMHTA